MGTSMEFSKPLITVTEKDVTIPDVLKQNIIRDLPQEGTEWERSYGRGTKTVFLEARLAPLIEEHFKVTPTKVVLFDRPLLYTYWVECYDGDVYKATVRDDMVAWVNKLQRYGINDLLIVVFETSDSKKANKTKLLPRSSIVDKIKADLPASLKNSADRCISFSDPLRNDPKSNDSYQLFLQRLRSLLSSSYSRQLTNYEDHIRTQREQRSSPDWNFYEFFIAQEELAFAFEMLSLFDEALVQYDELDALFSQFVLNSHVYEAPDWLKKLSEQCDSWHGLCLEKLVYMELRTKIERSTASLLDLRNYLFARQCDLLLLQNKPWEVASRSLPFLQNCINELNILEIYLIPGAAACWVFLGALEILLKCERYSDSSQMETYSRYTVGLWFYARNKLEELGTLCGLMPGMVYSSDCILKVVSLIGGIGKDPHLDTLPYSPQMRLKEALSKPESFLKQYLEISELTMGTYKHIGRLRFAKLIGKELALMYMRMNRHQQSLPFLLDLEKSYMAESWPILLADIRNRILECYQVLQDTKKQLRYTALLATSKSTRDAEREARFASATALIETFVAQEEQVVLKMDEIFSISAVNLSKHGTSIAPDLVLEINSNLCSEVYCHRIFASLLYEPIKPERRGSANALNREYRCRHGRKEAESESEKTPLFLTFSTNAVGVKCPNINDCLKRSDSHGYFHFDKEPQIVETDCSFTIHEAIVPPGLSEWTLKFCPPAEKCGEYSMLQIVFEWKKNVYLVMSQPLKHICFRVLLEEPKLRVVTPAKDLKGQQDLFAGVPQELSLEFINGSVPMPSGTTLTIKSVHGFDFIAGPDDNRLCNDVTVSLEKDLAPFDVLSIPVVVFVTLSNQKDAIGNEYELSLSYTCPDGSHPKALFCSFHSVPPFMSNMKLHTCNKLKFVEMLVHGIVDNKIVLKDWNLEVFEEAGQGTLVKPLANLNEMVLFKDQTVHYTWQLSHDTESACAAKLLFSTKYAIGNDLFRNSASNFYPYTCDFKLNDYHTLYVIHATVEPQKGVEFCRVGSVCFLYVVIEKTKVNGAYTSIMYEVTTDSALWTINGRTAGVLTNDADAKYNLEFEVLPMSSGFLPLPNIRLSKYISYEKVNTVSGKSDSGESKLVAFDTGQVYNKSRGSQVNVLPSSGLTSTE